MMDRGKRSSLIGISCCNSRRICTYRNIGDVHPDPYGIAAPRRLNSLMDGVRFPVKSLFEGDVVRKSGVPAARLEVTIARRADRGEDASLVADALVEAARSYFASDSERSATKSCSALPESRRIAKPNLSRRTTTFMRGRANSRFGKVRESSGKARSATE